MIIQQNGVTSKYDNTPRMLQHNWFKQRRWRWCCCAHGFDPPWEEYFTPWTLSPWYQCLPDPGPRGLWTLFPEPPDNKKKKK